MIVWIPEEEPQTGAGMRNPLMDRALPAATDRIFFNSCGISLSAFVEWNDAVEREWRG